MANWRLRVISCGASTSAYLLVRNASAKLNLAEATLKWRHKTPVPVVPDTLWCGHLFITISPLIILKKPRNTVYTIGYEPRLQVTTRLVKDRKRRFRVP